MYSEVKIVDTYVRSYYRVFNNDMLHGASVMVTFINLKKSSKCILSSVF